MMRKNIAGSETPGNLPEATAPGADHDQATLPKSASKRTGQAEPQAKCEAHRGQTFFKIAQLSVRWQLSQRHIAREIDRGQLTATYYGRSVRVALDDVLAYEAARRRKKK